MVNISNVFKFRITAAAGSGVELPSRSAPVVK